MEENDYFKSNRISIFDLYRKQLKKEAEHMLGKKIDTHASCAYNKRIFYYP